MRSSSPYGVIATSRLQGAVVSLAAFARRNPTFDASQLLPEAKRLLGAAQRDVQTHVNRNVFLARPDRGAQ